MTTDITQAIADRTESLTIERLLAKKGLTTVPPLIEIKGLGASVQSAKKAISDAKTETAGLTSDVSKLVAAVKDVRTQVNQHFDDLKFEAETLGNGSSQSEQSGEESKT